MPSYREFLNTQYFNSLNGIRCIAIVLTIGYHHLGMYEVKGIEVFALKELFHRGNLGVHLFFVVSGFLITTLLLREQQLNKIISIRSFYIRRLLRIFPVYYTVLFLNAIVLVPLFVPDGFRGDFYLNLPFYLTFTSNWFVTNPNSIFICAWTLATEEQFYLIWPHVLKVFNKWRAVIFVIITVIINQLAIFNASYHFKFLAPFENYLLFKIIQSISTPICFGVLLAFGLHSERFYKLFTIFRNKFSSLAYFLLMLFCIYVPNEITPLVALVTYFFMMLFVGSCVYQEKHFLSSLLNSKLFFQIGAVSYGMYLFNMMCIFQVRSLFYFMHWWNPFLEFIVSLAACYLLAHISFYYYENRFLLLKRKFSVVPTMFNQLKR